MSADARAAHRDDFLALFDDNGAPDKRLDPKEMTEYLLEEAASFGDGMASFDALSAPARGG